MKLPIKGTEILFLDNGKWYNMNSDGTIVNATNAKYAQKYTLDKSFVVIEGEDDTYLSGLNGGEITIVTDKNAINRPNLLSFSYTKEWMSLTHYLWLRDNAGGAFCHMAHTYHIPDLKK